MSSWQAATRAETGDTQFNSGTEAQIGLDGKRGLAPPSACQSHVGLAARQEGCVRHDPFINPAPDPVLAGIGNFHFGRIRGRHSITVRSARRWRELDSPVGLGGSWVRIPPRSRLSTRWASAQPGLHSAVASKSFAADHKSETIAGDGPRNAGNIGKNRKPPTALSVQPGRFGHSGKPDDAWLARQEKEPILEPELPIIDTHHHLWDRGGWKYLLPELLADLNTGHNIVATVFEECRSMYRAHGLVEMRPVGEVEFVAGIAAMSASGGYGQIKAAQGIVGYADLALGDRVEPVLEALIRAGVARLAARGLVLDAWCYHPQLADVIALARAVPQATIVMCHVGGVLGYGAYAGKKDEVHAAWRASMAKLTTCPNVFVKLGGMLNRGAALNFRELPESPNSAAWAAAWRPYVEPCIDLFGAERCSFESNFPVDKMGTGYATLWNAFKRITAGCSPTEKLALYSGTARRLYRLD